MPHHSRYSIAPVSDEATLPHALHSFAVHQVPGQVYQVVQLALPLAYELWSHDLFRLAGSLAALSAFGLWALCEQRLNAETALHERGLGSAAWVVSLVRAGRGVTGITATLLAFALASESFIRLLSLVTGRVGVAG